MTEFLVAAPTSGAGKTTMVCALLAALQAQGESPCAFKCGPDYIDPMFHRAVLGLDSYNLDLFFSTPETVRHQFALHSAGHSAVVCEGAMGFYDGLGGTTTDASAWAVADALDLPVLLVLRPKGASLPLAAQVQGLQRFRTPSHIAGILLNDCTPSLHALLAPMLERETGVPVLGYLPHLPEAELPSRHLGLYTAAELSDLKEKIQLLQTAAQVHIQWPRLHTLCKAAPREAETAACSAPRVKIAIARDEAFCFTYAETLETLRQAGAELAFFSPMQDEILPDGADGLYLPGGYPELHAEALSRNCSMRRAIRDAVRSGLPTVAECGGFLYLGQSLRDSEGAAHPMAGVLPGEGFRVGRLVRFGYAQLSAAEDSLLFRAGEQFPVHEFHHWDSTENGAALTAVKPATGKRWQCGFTSSSLYAGFPHLYWAGTPLPGRFVDAAEQYKEHRT